MPANDDIFEFGKNIHALASYYLKGENIGKMKLTAQEEKVWNYLKNSKYFGYEVIGTELSLAVKVDGRFFGGRLDALVKEDETYYILDYKTGEPPKDAKYDYQTIIYVLAVKEFFNTENIVFVYLDLKNEREVKTVYAPNLYEEYKAKLIYTARKIENTGCTQKKADCKCEYTPICF